jgi:segregation and condensation protein A
MGMDRGRHTTGIALDAEGESPYLTDYVGPDRYEEYDGGEQVINHLMFYKSIISEEDSGQKISEYMELVRGLKEGEHLPIKDPFDKSIALTFELVMQNHLNPWDVDLLKFSTLYMDRMKHEEEVDFITAGRLMFMAWSVMKLQSDEVLANNQPKPEEQPLDAGWDPGASGDWMQSDASVDFTTAVLNRPEAPIQESVWRKGTRPVTLFELVGAFEEARKEAELQKVLSEERKKQRLLWEGQKALKVDQMMHREDLQEDINNIWCRIKPLSGRIPLTKLCPTGCDEEHLTAFVSVLFLAFVNQIRVWQENFPYGEIFLEKAGTSELNLENLQNITHPQKKEIWDVKKGKKKGGKFTKKTDAKKGPKDLEKASRQNRRIDRTMGPGITHSGR